MYRLLYLLCGSLLFLCNFFIGQWALSLPPIPHPIFTSKAISFSIDCLTNTGAAWGILSSHPWLLFFFRSCFFFGLIGYLLFFNHDKKWVLPLTLIATGAAGNIWDFISYGYVIDMFHFQFWGWNYPTFNVADVTILFGVLLLFLRGL